MPRERTLVVGLARGARGRVVAEDHLDELCRLADTAGGEVVARVVKEIGRPDPATLIGRGQAEEIGTRARETEAGLVIFDDDLSPAQLRNLEKLISARILDRSGLILDIFARRARSHEARTQVELAQLNYFLPRLTRRWTHLERQEGRIGSRGVGETQLELDRRIIKSRISRLKKELVSIERQRRQRRAGRSDAYKVALVGYTNAGKSTLMNRLTGADVFIEDRLFATLDALVRRIPDDGARSSPIVLIDTVGFIRKLPHQLVASFRSTLEEVVDADVIVHVIDASHASAEEHARTTLQVLAEIGAGDSPVITVFNKIDLVVDARARAALERQHPDALFVSALERDNLEDLMRRIRASREIAFEVARLRVPQAQGAVLARLRAFEVMEETYDEGDVWLTVRGRRADLRRLVQQMEERRGMAER